MLFGVGDDLDVGSVSGLCRLGDVRGDGRLSGCLMIQISWVVGWELLFHKRLRLDPECPRSQCNITILLIWLPYRHIHWLVDTCDLSMIKLTMM